MRRIVGELNFTRCDNAVRIGCCIDDEVGINIDGVWLIVNVKQAESLMNGLIEWSNVVLKNDTVLLEDTL